LRRIAVGVSQLGYKTAHIPDTLKGARTAVVCKFRVAAEGIVNACHFAGTISKCCCMAHCIGNGLNPKGAAILEVFDGDNQKNGYTKKGLCVFQ
jgi:hypothetical protein